MDILAGIVIQALRMIGFWWVSGMRESSPPQRCLLFAVAVESRDHGGARAAWALKNRSL